MSEHDDFLLRPNLVYVPFGSDPTASGLRIDELLERTAIAHGPEGVEAVDTDMGRVQLVGGRQLPLRAPRRRERAREHVDIGLVTYEVSFVEACGPRMHEVIEREFAERRIEGRAAERLTDVHAHEASFAGGRTERFNLLVTIPPHSRVSATRGFQPTSEASCV